MFRSVVRDQSFCLGMESKFAACPVRDFLIISFSNLHSYICSSSFSDAVRHLDVVLLGMRIGDSSVDAAEVLDVETLFRSGLDLSGLKLVT